MESILFNNQDNIYKELISNDQSESTKSTLTEPLINEELPTEPQPVEPPGRMLINFYFLMCGIGMSMAWYSISAAVGFFVKKFGAAVYTEFLAAYFIPALPLTLLQTRYDDVFDRKYGSKPSYNIRMYAAFGTLFASAISIPFLPYENLIQNKILLYFIGGLIGFFDSVGYGALSQMGGHFPGKCSTWLFMGQSVTSILLLIISLIIKFTDDPGYSIVVQYFSYSASWIAIACVAYFLLMRSQFTNYYLDIKDKKSKLANTEGSDKKNEDEKKTPKRSFRNGSI